MGENPKLQILNPKENPSPKNSNDFKEVFRKIGTWCFNGTWNLVLGTLFGQVAELVYALA